MLWPAFSLTGALLLLTGVAYPALLYAVGRITMPWAAGGSLLRDHGGRVVGSAYIGQAFVSARYFHGRPSAVAYDAAGSGASNLGPTNPALADSIGQYSVRFRATNGLASTAWLPSDAVTASGSGLDPDISPGTAALQIARVAASRRATTAAVAALVRAHTVQPVLGIIGEPRINVLRLNLALDSLDSLDPALPAR
jgi:K+-transporting ATPase ATPase C chain